MALKDWKKKGGFQGENSIGWKHRDKNITVGISKRFGVVGGNNKYANSLDDKWWTLSVFDWDRHTSILYEHLNAKTKSQALKYARAYMRKH